MRSKILVLTLLLTFTQVFAQYPEVTIKDIQDISDSVLANPADYLSPLEGDTVTVTGVVMHEIFIGGDPANDYVLHSGGPSLFLQDPNFTEWGGLLVRRTSNLSDDENANFATLDSGFTVKLTGVVSEYPSNSPGTTQFNLIKFEGSDVTGITTRPQPQVITIDSLVYPTTGEPKYMAEKWEGMYVEIRNVTVTHTIGTGGSSFGIFDENNNLLTVDDKSAYFSSAPRPLNGSKLEYIRGFIGNRTNLSPAPLFFTLDPIYPSDIKYGDVSPPNIVNVERTKVTPQYGETIDINARVYDTDGSSQVAGVKLFYSVNGGASTEVVMNLSNSTDSIYTATIPAQNDSSLVSFYIEAVDGQNAVSHNPVAYETNPYFFHILNRPLTIQDVQYSPFGTGITGYDSYEVTVRGIVTADTSDIEGDGNQTGAQVIIQNGTGKWSGIQVFGTEVLTLQRGDDVTITGIVDENFGVTRIEDIDAPSQLVKHGTAAVPEATLITTDMIGTSSGGTLPAEAYEGVLVKYMNVTVIDENADGNAGPGGGGNNNFGEMLVADASNVQTRIEMQDGTHDFHNYWMASQENDPNRIETGNTIEEITGIMFYSFSNYKLIPRSNSDFVNVVTDIETSTVIPDEYSLAQNYPNPFNPTTTIEYSLPEQSMVKLTIYNLLGQEIVTLVNALQNQGSHKVTFDARNLPSGIYFYKMESNNFVQTKKLMLLK